MIRWLLLIPLALILAVSASTLFLLVVCVIDPIMADLMGATVAAGFRSLLEAIFASDEPDLLVLDTLRDIGRVLFVFLVLPPLLVVLVSEVTRAGRLLWLAGGTGVLTAAVPWILRGSSSHAATPAELHISAVLGLTGAVAGLVYWAIAGRSRVTAPPSPGS